MHRRRGQCEDLLVRVGVLLPDLKPFPHEVIILVLFTVREPALTNSWNRLLGCLNLTEDPPYPHKMVKVSSWLLERTKSRGVPDKSLRPLPPSHELGINNATQSHHRSILPQPQRVLPNGSLRSPVKENSAD